MKKDHKIIILEHINLYYICNRLRNKYPEYSQPDARVNIEYVKLIIRIEDLFLSKTINSNVAPSFINNEEAISILKRLSPAIIKNPMSLKTIDAVLNEYNQLEYRNMLSDIIDCEAENASEHNNRANARFEAGRYDEALNDYTHACELEPDEIGYFRSRAQLLLKLNMKQKALRDIRYINERILKNNLLQYLTIFPSQIQLNFKCHKYDMVLKLTERYFDQLSSILPNTRITNNTIEIEKDGIHICMSIDHVVKEVIHCFRKICLYDKSRENSKNKKLMQKINNQVLYLKSSIKNKNYLVEIDYQN